MRYLVFIFFIVLGCAAAPIDSFQSDKDRYDWESCRLVYKQSGVHTYSTHVHQRGRKHRDWEIRDDLVYNNCASILGRME